MAKSRTNRRFRKKSKKSSRKSSRTRKYKGGMKITGMAFLGLLASCTYLVDASFFKVLKGAVATRVAIEVNKAIQNRIQSDSAPPATPVAARTDDGGIIIGTVDQLKVLKPTPELQAPQGQPTFAPELLVAVKCNVSDFKTAVTQLHISDDVQTLTNHQVSELPKILQNFEEQE